MEPSDESDARAFWNYMQRTTGARSASWDTFSATFETYMRRYYSAGMEQLPAATPAEMVLRYAFDRGNPPRAAASERVTPRHMALFLKRFGPMDSCIVKAARSLFNESGCLVPWFHGRMSRHEAAQAIDNWETSHGNGGPQKGVFLFRYSDRPDQPAISFSYRRSNDMRVVCCLINNGPQGYVLPDAREEWQNLRDFVMKKHRALEHPVLSALHFECKNEIDDRRRNNEAARTPEDEIADARRLFGEAQRIMYSETPEGTEVALLERVLEIVEEVVFRLRLSVSGEKPLKAKALRMAGDILCKLGREEDGVASYLRCLTVVAEAEELEQEGREDSPVVTAGTLSHVHQSLARFFLERGLANRALHHFSELVACTTDEEARQQLTAEFRRIEGFERAIAGLTHASVEAMLEEGISYFRRKEYEPARIKFEKVLRDARCIGEGRVEARALGNLATVDYKTERIPAAIRRYRTCVQLLRQQGNQVTERKILNYLVMCCIEARRWALSRLFHEQLSTLAESEDNIQHLARLEARIQEGMKLEARLQEKRYGPDCR